MAVLVYSNAEGHLVTNPEYGGDGKKTDRCGSFTPPIVAFPAHWAPNDLVFYTGTQFPKKYQGGVFVAFHGSWNRAPLPMAGYNITFVPFSGGKPGHARSVRRRLRGQDTIDGAQRRGVAARRVGRRSRRIALHHRGREGQDLAGHLHR